MDILRLLPFYLLTYFFSFFHCFKVFFLTKKLFTFYFYVITVLLCFLLISVLRKQRGMRTFPQNETLAVASWDTLENGTFEWIPDPRVLIREVRA